MSACQIHQSCSGGGEKLKYFRGLLAWHWQCFPLMPIGCSFKLCYVLTQVFLRLNLFFEFFWSHTSSVKQLKRDIMEKSLQSLHFWLVWVMSLPVVLACFWLSFSFVSMHTKTFFCLFVLNLNVLSLSLYNKHGKHYKDYSLLWDSSCPSNPELDRRLRKWMEGGLVASFLAM